MSFIYFCFIHLWPNLLLPFTKYIFCLVFGPDNKNVKKYIQWCIPWSTDHGYRIDTKYLNPWCIRAGRQHVTVILPTTRFRDKVPNG